MMGTTPNYRLPYPEQDTLITDSALIVRELAERIDTALAQANASDSYTVPGALVQDFTASGTFTPPAGVSVVHVVVVGGGGKGGDCGRQAGVLPTQWVGGGGGGQVVVYRDVPVSGPVTVTVGGSGTASSFGGITANAGRTVQPYEPGVNFPGIGWGPNLEGSGGSPIRSSDYPGGVPATPWPTNGWNGIRVNGTWYGGGGGGSSYYTTRHAGGAGGGGGGAWTRSTTPPQDMPALPGTNGLGGGGGGGGSYSNGPELIGGLGGSGRVMVFTEQAYKSAHVPRPAPDPTIVAAIDDHDQALGVYAVDPDAPDLPGMTHARLVDYPTDPIDTGRIVTVPDDPNDPNSPTHDEPVLVWPAAGWTYTDTDGWKEPTP